MPQVSDDALFLCCLLWARPGQEAGLESYEDTVLALVSEHRGVVLQRAKSDGDGDRPHEVQLYRFADRDALNGYLNDPRRLALADERDRVIARTETFPVTLL
jgi:antibiotic biosynthesis monooxygenase (ABM) superfamily enzyme